MNLRDDIVQRLPQSRLKALWFREAGEYEVYLRLGPRIFGDRVFNLALTLADVTVHRKGQGVFTQLLDDIEAAARRLDADAVLVENVVSQIVIGALMRRGYRSRAIGGLQLNMALSLNAED